MNTLERICAARHILRVNLEMTGYCSMRCPDCTQRIHAISSAKREHHPWEYFENAARYLKGIQNVQLTGGEPSFHPEFANFIPKFKELFQCESLEIETNGYGFKKFPEVYKHFDLIACTIYQPDSFPGCPDNTDGIRFIREYYKGQSKPKIIEGKTIFVPISNRSGTTMCTRGWQAPLVAYYRGLLYPCCVGPGLLPEHGIPLTENWREDISKVTPKCSQCWFAAP